MLNIFYNLVRVDYASLDKQLLREIQTTEAQGAATGTLSSGRTILIVCEAGAASLSVRCRLAWSQLYKVMSAHGLKIDRETGPMFVSEIGAQASNAAITVRSIVNGSAVFRSSLPANAKKAGMDIIDKELQHEIARMKAEADLLIAASENLQPTTSKPGISINGDGNVIISGDGNQVNVSTQINSEAATALVDALKLTLDRLHSIPPEPKIDASELKQLIGDAIDDVKAPKPNGLKVKVAVKTIAETIKFIPAFKAAYDTIKSAAALANIYLP